MVVATPGSTPPDTGRADAPEVDAASGPQHDRPMKAPALPATALALAALWCLAQAVDSRWLAAVVAVAAMWAAAATAALRRSNRRLRLAVAVPMLLLGAGLAVVLVAPAGSAVGLAAQLAVLFALAPLAPLLYAATFDRGAGGES